MSTHDWQPMTDFANRVSGLISEATAGGLSAEDILIALALVALPTHPAFTADPEGFARVLDQAAGKMRRGTNSCH
jgi:hypothetical protein